MKVVLTICDSNVVRLSEKAQLQFATMKNHIEVYFQESSIHGFRWIVSRDLHIVEKLLWIVSLLISFVCCGLLIYEIGVKYNEDAMVVYKSDTAITVLEVSSSLVDVVL
jgi:hypothetical protein